MVFLLGGIENLGETDSLNLKSPCQISSSIKHVAPVGQKTQNCSLSNLNTVTLRYMQCCW